MHYSKKQSEEIHTKKNQPKTQKPVKNTKNHLFYKKISEIESINEDIMQSQ
jgi:hypothetical protein